MRSCISMTVGEVSSNSSSNGMSTELPHEQGVSTFKEGWKGVLGEEEEEGALGANERMGRGREAGRRLERKSSSWKDSARDGEKEEEEGSQEESPGCSNPASATK